MSKFVIDAAMDALLNHVANNAAMLRVCSGDPADRAAAVAATLANVDVDNTDYTLADGDVSGRKATMQQQLNIPITADGTAATIVVDDGVNILQKTDVTPQALTSGGTVTVNAFAQEVRDAA